MPSKRPTKRPVKPLKKKITLTPATRTRASEPRSTLAPELTRKLAQAAEAAAQETALHSGRNAPLVLGVTVLTSMENGDLAAVGVNPNVGHQVERLAALAAQAGLRGLVCSPLEIVALRQTLPATMQLVTPGIRAADDAAGDQKRTLSAREALDAGANWLVIGRPICAAPNPRAAAEKILESLR